MIAWSTSSSNLFSSIGFSIYLVYVVRILGLDPLRIGLVFSLGSFGTLAGALLATRISARAGVGRTIVGSIALGGPAGLLIAIAPVGGAEPYLIAAAALVGFSSLVYNINQISFRQAITPERMQGRMNATMRFLVWGTMPIGSLIGGILATVFGLSSTIWISAILGFLPFLFVFFSPVRSLQTMPTSPEDWAARKEALDAAAAVEPAPPPKL
jgi:MFS family permease